MHLARAPSDYQVEKLHGDIPVREEQLLPIDRLLRALRMLNVIRRYRVAILRDHKYNIKNLVIDFEANNDDE